MSAQSTALSICLWRFVAAIGVGAESVAVDAYLAELMPKDMRGRGFAISQSIQFMAVPLTGLLAAVLARKTVAGVQGWRMMLFVPIVGAVLHLVGPARTAGVAALARGTWKTTRSR